MNPDYAPENSPLDDVPPKDIPTEQWLKNAVASVDRSIAQLSDDFIRHPFTHRVEHSFHIQLYDLLVHQRPLRGRVRIGQTSYSTQLIHKEWPSDQKVAITSGANPTRQRYDLGILTPESVTSATLAEFTQGDISAQIVIELGLDYSLKHLEGDFDKLNLNNVRYPYIVHFSRKRTRQARDIETLIAAAPSHYKTAFVHLDVMNLTRVIKRLDRTEFERESYWPEEPTS